MFFFLVVTAVFSYLYFFQEKMIFFPDKLSSDFQFTFPYEFEEVQIGVDRDIQLHGILFKAPKAKGLIFYLHGNAGSVESWGKVAGLYLKNNYDIFVLDYRGYGKSQGRITSENQLHKDIQLVYNELVKSYLENDVFIIGYSIGTGMAAHLAAENNPSRLILIAPYYSLVDIIHHYYPFIPSPIVKYQLMTNKEIGKISAPITIFHGDQDEVIYIESSKKLIPLLKPNDEYIVLKGQMHNGINDNVEYVNYIDLILK
ncbi:alpha/beta fold hydrolase [Cytophagales bacterium RKSG123]|nr:alpha/beta fold hydrolase [Xanthovirga aplysinae]